MTRQASLVRPQTTATREPRHRQADIFVGPSPSEVKFRERERRIAAVRVELRFGPGSVVAQMLGLTTGEVS